MEWSINNTSKLKRYSSEIEQMFIDSYSKIGAVSFLEGFNGMSNYYPCSAYILNSLDDTQIIQGIIMYWKSDYGNKIGLVISRDPDIGKKHVIPKLVELLKTPGFYVELSDALEYLVRKAGLQNINDSSIILKLIPGIKDDDIFTENDKRREEYKLGKEFSPHGSYIRHIHGIGLHRKALYGIPCFEKQFNTNTCSRKCIYKGGKKTRRKHNKRRI